MSTHEEGQKHLRGGEETPKGRSRITQMVCVREGSQHLQPLVRRGHRLRRHVAPEDPRVRQQLRGRAPAWAYGAWACGAWAWCIGVGVGVGIWSMASSDATRRGRWVRRTGGQLQAFMVIWPGANATRRSLSEGRPRPSDAAR